MATRIETDVYRVMRHLVISGLALENASAAAGTATYVRTSAPAKPVCLHELKWVLKRCMQTDKLRKTKREGSECKGRHQRPQVCSAAAVSIGRLEVWRGRPVAVLTM